MNEEVHTHANRNRAHDRNENVPKVYIYAVARFRALPHIDDHVVALAEIAHNAQRFVDDRVATFVCKVFFNVVFVSLLPVSA